MKKRYTKKIVIKKKLLLHKFYTIEYRFGVDGMSIQLILSKVLTLTTFLY